MTTVQVSGYPEIVLNDLITRFDFEGFEVQPYRLCDVCIKQRVCPEQQVLGGIHK